MADYKACKYGCKALPCVHDKWAEHKDVRKNKPNAFVRPRMAVLNGRQVVLDPKHNAVTCELYKNSKQSNHE